MQNNITTIGTITHGTLRTVDLLDAFIGEADRIDRVTGGDMTEAHGSTIAEARSLLERLQEAETHSPDRVIERLTEEASELLDGMADALNEFAPLYAYFGAHPGDGSDFGFWPDFDAIEELPRFDDLSGADDVAEDFVIVNDHGNVSVYGADQSLLWDCV